MKGGKPDEPKDKAALRLRDFEKARSVNKDTDDQAKPDPKNKATDKSKNPDTKDQDC